MDIYDVFTLMETLMSESRLMEGVYALGHQYRLDSQESLQFLKIDVQETEANYAVDIRDPSVIVRFSYCCVEACLYLDLHLFSVMLSVRG